MLTAYDTKRHFGTSSSWIAPGRSIYLGSISRWQANHLFGFCSISSICLINLPRDVGETQATIRNVFWKKWKRPFRLRLSRLSEDRLSACFGALAVMLASCIHGAGAGCEERAVWCSVDQFDQWHEFKKTSAAAISDRVHLDPFSNLVCNIWKFTTWKLTKINQG